MKLSSDNQFRLALGTSFFLQAQTNLMESGVVGHLLKSPSVSRQSGRERNSTHCRMMGGTKTPGSDSDLSSSSWSLPRWSLIHSREAPNCWVGRRDDGEDDEGDRATPEATAAAATAVEVEVETEGWTRLTSFASCLQREEKQQGWILTCHRRFTTKEIN